MPTPKECPKCHLPVFMGLEAESEFGVICERPEERFVGNGLSSLTGKVLGAELAKAGLMLNELRVTYLWKHEPKEEEFKWHLLETIKFLKGCRLILMLGTEVTKPLLGYNAGDVSGIWATSDFFPQAQVMVGPNPGTLLRGTVGEMRLALNRFASRTKTKPRGKR